MRLAAMGLGAGGEFGPGVDQGRVVQEALHPAQVLVSVVGVLLAEVGGAGREGWGRAVAELGVGGKFKDEATEPGRWSIGATGFVTGAIKVTEAPAAPGFWLRYATFIGGIRDGIGGYFFAVSENRRLKAEIAELEQWRDDAIVLKGVGS